MKGRIMTICFLLTGGLLAGCSSTPKVPEGEFLMQGELTNVPDKYGNSAIERKRKSTHNHPKRYSNQRKILFPRYYQRCNP